MADKVVELSKRSSYLRNSERFSLVILGKEEGLRPKLRIAWLVAWVIIGLLVTREASLVEFSKDVRMVLIIFLSFWAYYLFRIYRAVRWNQVGKEMLMIKGEYLIHKNSFGEIGRSRQYHISNVIDARAREKTVGFSSLFEDSFFSIGIGSIEIPAEGKILLIAKRIDDAESQKIIKLFNKEIKEAQKALT